MKISVIIPTYNEEDHIGECLDSLNTQTYKDYEVIVVDASPDDIGKENQKNCINIIENIMVI